MKIIQNSILKFSLIFMLLFSVKVSNSEITSGFNGLLKSGLGLFGYSSSNVKSGFGNWKVWLKAGVGVTALSIIAYLTFNRNGAKNKGDVVEPDPGVSEKKEPEIYVPEKKDEPENKLTVQNNSGGVKEDVEPVEVNKTDQGILEGALSDEAAENNKLMEEAFDRLDLGAIKLLIENGVAINLLPFCIHEEFVVI